MMKQTWIMEWRLTLERWRRIDNFFMLPNLIFISAWMPIDMERYQCLNQKKEEKSVTKMSSFLYTATHKQINLSTRTFNLYIQDFWIKQSLDYNGVDHDYILFLDRGLH